MISVQLSVGEVVDRFSIMKLKRQHNPENPALIAAENELRRSLHSYFSSTSRPWPVKLADSLDEANQLLWDAENHIRELHTAKPTDIASIVSTSLCIAQVNEMRSILKQRINRYYLDDQSEVKIYGNATTEAGDEPAGS